MSTHELSAIAKLDRQPKTGPGVEYCVAINNGVCLKRSHARSRIIDY